jgi:hypothetical protein
MPNVAQIIEQLQDQERTLATEVDRISSQLTCKKTEIKSIQDAIRALQQRSAKRSSKKPSKPSVNKQDVVSAIQDALQDETPMTADALKEAVQEKLQQEGKSMQGFALRFKEALADSRFVTSAAGYRLTNSFDSPEAGEVDSY